MKKILNMLLIFSICMIGFTSMASTPLVKQKQETTITLEKSVEVVKVQFTSFEVAEMNATIFTETNQNLKSFIHAYDVGYEFENLKLVSKTFNFDYSAVLVETCFESKKQFIHNTIYKEDMNSKFIIDFKKLISNIGFNRQNQLS